MSKFNVGDEVVRTCDPTQGFLPKGTKGIVVEVRGIDIYLKGIAGAYREENFELVEKKLPSYIVDIPAHKEVYSWGLLTENVSFAKSAAKPKTLALRDKSGHVNMPYLDKKEILELAEALKELASYMED